MKLEEYKKLYKEEFRPIKLGNGFDKYEVSNYGNFRLIGRNKNVKLTIQKNGYHSAHFNSLYTNLLKPIGSTLISSLKNKKIYKKISDKYFKDVISNSRNKRTPND